MKKQSAEKAEAKSRNVKTNMTPVVAIGAGAGGNAAMQQLLQQLPAATGLAYVYIQTNEAVGIETLSPHTAMKVCISKDRQRIQPDCLYIIPSGKTIAAAEGFLIIQPERSKGANHLPIDQFFISLANTYKNAAIGILLSGSSTDGTWGLKAIKAAGGLVFTQDGSAKFTTMAKSAIAEGVVDMSLAPVDLADKLTHLGTQAKTLELAMHSEDDVIAEDYVEDIRNILQLLKKSTGVDFSHYKITTISRRIIRRMLMYKLQTLAEYLQYIKQHTAEINTLYQDLLINVTCFFRDPDAIEYIKKTVLPRIINNKASGEPIRIWIPACATGEEAYSIAIIMVELLGDKLANTAVQIFATDLSEPAIIKARLGKYTKSDVAEMDTKRVQRFFTKVDDGYRIIKLIRDLCVFAPHNVFTDPPFSRLDYVGCCNLMIYLEPVLQKKLLTTFHYALNPNGVLVLGKSETIGQATNLFTLADKKYKIYFRKQVVNSGVMFEMAKKSVEEERAKPIITGVKTLPADNLDKMVDDVLLKRFIPATVLVTPELEILQFRGSIGLFLDPSPGKATLNLLKMAKPGLSIELRNIVHKANKTGQAYKRSGIELKNNDGTSYISIEAVPLTGRDDGRLFLVVFQEVHASEMPTAKGIYSKDKLVKQLQDELQAVREDMRSVVEEQEVSNEELQSANEEIVSSNEELQSINEELETSKEELESANEEMQTINQELQTRNDQLAESYDYAEAMFSTIREASLILDRNLRIKSANRAFYRMFLFNEEDTEGRLIYELDKGQWNIPQLKELLENILTHNAQFQGFRIMHTFPTIGEKVLLVNARRVIQKTQYQEIILMAIEDITEYEEAQRIIAKREAWFREMGDSAPVMIWAAGTDRMWHFVNKTWLEYTGSTLQESVGMGWLDKVHKDDKKRVLEVYNNSFITGESFKVEYRLRRHDGEYRWVQCMGRTNNNPEGTFTGWFGSCTEIHDQRLINAELEQRVALRTKALKEANSNLERSNKELEQFAYVASHDLQEPLRKIVTFGNRLHQKHKKDLTPEAASYIDKMNQSAARMTDLIDDLLNFSRVAKAQEKFIEVDLNKTIKDVIKDFDVAFKQSKTTMHVEDLPHVFAIPLQMRQMFHNLISNSVKFSSDNEVPEIWISGKVLDEEEVKNAYPDLSPGKQYCEILVRDNGIGFSQKFSEQIFIIFQRLYDSQKYPGTGIGLALCKKIATHTGGLIFANSREGEGAQFHIVLPVYQS